jgi:hypothetical protein
MPSLAHRLLFHLRKIDSAQYNFTLCENIAFAAVIAPFISSHPRVLFALIVISRETTRPSF